MVRILIVDDHEMIRRGLRLMLEQHRGWEICGESSNGRQAVEIAQKTLPHVVLLDVAIPEMNGLEATRAIKKVLPNTEVLVFTMHETEELTREVLSAGARGFMLKTDAGRGAEAAAPVGRRPIRTPSTGVVVLVLSSGQLGIFAQGFRSRPDGAAARPPYHFSRKGVLSGVPLAE